MGGAHAVWHRLLYDELDVGSGSELFARAAVVGVLAVSRMANGEYALPLVTR